MISKRNFGKYFGKYFGRISRKNYNRAFLSVSTSRLHDGIEIGINFFFDKETPFCINIALVKFIITVSFLEIIFDEI